MTLALRLYTADDADELPVVSSPTSTEPAGPTLRDIWDQFKLPELLQDGRAADTLSEYTRHLDRWEEWCRSDEWQKKRIAYPLLRSIDRATLLAWRAWLVEEYDLGARSANKHLGSIHALLACAEAHGRLSVAPKLPPLSHRAAATKLYLTYDEIDRLYRACDVATWPNRDGKGEPLGYTAASGWQSLIVLLFNYGLRTQEAVRYEPDAVPLLWRQIHRGRESPAEGGRACCDWGWLAYVPTKQARSKPEPLVLPLNEATAWHLSRLEPEGGADPASPIFDWPRCYTSFYRAWDAIVAAAGVQPKANPVTGETRKYQLKHFRKTCATWLNHHRPGIAGHITGHAERSESAVLTRHYVNVEMDVLSCMRTFPQPSAFEAAMRGNSQRRLF